MQIWKFPLDITAGIQVVKAPGWLEVRAVQMQDGKITIWGEVIPGQDEAEFRFQVFGTGHHVSGRWQHRGTVQHEGFVWHLYQAPIS